MWTRWLQPPRDDCTFPVQRFSSVKDHSREVWWYSIPWFRRRCYFNESVDGRRASMITIAHFNWKKSTYYEPYDRVKEYLSLIFDIDVITVIWNPCYNLFITDNHCANYEHPLSSKQESTRALGRSPENECLYCQGGGILFSTTSTNESQSDLPRPIPWNSVTTDVHRGYTLITRVMEAFY